MATATVALPSEKPEKPEKKKAKIEVVNRIKKTGAKQKWLTGSPQGRKAEAVETTKPVKAAKVSQEKPRRPAKATGTAKYEGNAIKAGDFVKMDLDVHVWTEVLSVSAASIRAKILEEGNKQYHRGREMWIYMKYAIGYAPASEPPKLAK